MGQQTSVEWFADEILKAAIVFLYNEKNEGKFSLAYDELLEQAKQMEEEQHGNTWLNGQVNVGIKKTFQQYYNETYGTDKTT
jgi:hypothetical protein